MKVLVASKKQMSAKYTKLLFLFFLFSCATQVRKIQRPFYWKIQDQDKTIFVLGTMHAGFSLKSLPDYVVTDISTSSIVAMEHTFEELKEVDKQEEEQIRLYANKAGDYYPDLRKVLLPDTWKRLKFTLKQEEVRAFISKFGVNYEAEHIHPAMISLMTIHFSQNRAPYLFHPDIVWQESHRYSSYALFEEKRSVMDHEILNYATTLKKTIIGLDTIEHSLKALAKVKGDYGITFIERFYGLHTNAKYQLEQMQLLQQAYESGQESKLETYLAQTKSVEDELLNSRNKHWFKVLRARKEKNIFVGVGALHLVGPKSLIRLFQENGAQVVRQN